MVGATVARTQEALNREYTPASGNLWRLWSYEDFEEWGLSRLQDGMVDGLCGDFKEAVRASLMSTVDGSRRLECANRQSTP